jgi:hypothetical protein
LIIGDPDTPQPTNPEEYSRSRAGYTSSCEQNKKQANKYPSRDSFKQTPLAMPPPEKTEVELAFMSEDTAKAFALLGLNDPC